jgi:acetyl-CoA C-acetyltransferase
MTVRVASVGLSRFGKRDESLVELATESAAVALEGVGRKPIDLLVVGTMLGHGPGGPLALLPRLAGRLGLESATGLRVEAAMATGAMAFQAAVQAMEAGRADRALVVAAEKMTDVPTPALSRELVAALHESEAASGATMVGLGALVAQRYLQRHDLSEERCGLVSVHDRDRSTHNPYAQFSSPVTAEEVSSSKPVALPLRLLHCAAISDGAAAVVLEKGNGAAAVLGLGQGFDALRLIDRNDLTTFAATRLAARRAYEEAHLTRKNVEVVELHDAFAPFGFVHLEDLGFCGPGEGPSWYEHGWVRADGRLPVNPSGGLLGRGHPVAATGLAAIAEVALQLRGEAGSRSIAKTPTVGLAHSMAGLGAQNFVTILGGAAA